MSSSSKPDFDAIIIGAGLAGLSCALDLQAAGKSILLLEASDRVGGRLRTDQENGYTFDHGFQVLLTDYSECRRLLDYSKLALGTFDPGAYIWTGKSFDVVADPLRQPSLLFRSLKSSAGSISDKLRIAALKRKLTHASLFRIYEKPETSTREHLRNLGLSPSLIDSFLRPFFSGIFLEPDLASSSRMFDFVFKSFAQGHAALPANGMASIPLQLAAAINPNSIHLNQRVISASSSRVEVESGPSYTARNVIIATDMTQAASLSPAITDRGWNGTQCFYFSTDASPLSRPMIALNASDSGCIQNLAVVSDAQPSYAPRGKSLICVSTKQNTATSPDSIATELGSWFARSADRFTFLRSYKIPHSLPRQNPGDLPFETASLRTEDGKWICGDHRYSSSIQGALRSGAKVAAAILES